MSVERQLLLRMRTGSHLYGTHHAFSDEDWLEVWDRLPGGRRATQTISAGHDVTCVSLSEFMRQASAGVPQAVEAMFAPSCWPELDRLGALRQGFRPDVAATANTYRRTISALLRGTPSLKARRHAVRLGWQLDQLIRFGRFDPTDRSWLDSTHTS